MSLWSRIERRLSDLAGDLLVDEHRAQLAQARSLLEKGDAHAAAELCENVLAQRPDQLAALSLVGAARLALGDAAGARRAFDAAVAQNDTFPELLLGRGNAALADGDTEEAIASFRAALRLAGGDRAVLAAVYRGLGAAFRSRDEVEKAVRELRKAVAEAPRDPEALAALADALLAAKPPAIEDAKRFVNRAREHTDRRHRPPALGWLALGRIAEAERDWETAAVSYERALESASGSPGKADPLRRRVLLAARLGLSVVALARGQTTAAHDHLLRALEIDPQQAEVHARLGDLHCRVGDFEAALRSYQSSLALEETTGVVRRGLAAAIEVGAKAAAVDLADRLLAKDSGDPQALIGRGLAFTEDEQYDSAQSLFERALTRGGEVEAHVALGRLELARATSPSAGARAASHALAALRLAPANERARNLLAAARTRELADCTPRNEDSGDRSGPYQLATQLHKLCSDKSELAELTAAAGQTAAEFDQPLMVTIMGEFSSGKSTFVNAFIGEEIAPTGITPTTATINVVKYGRERGGRIRFRDGRAETLPWPALLARLRQLDAETARDVDWCEILVPLADLEQIHLVDTPGLNSILPEHEATAKHFLARADAVVWLFTAGQAGKASERRALEELRGLGVRVLGVLNKVDQLSEEDANQVARYIAGELGDLVELVVPLSAQEALAAKQRARTAPAPIAAGETGARRSAAEEAGHWAALQVALEERFFAQARAIKRRVSSRRLDALLVEARQRIDRRSQAAQATANALRAAEREMCRRTEQFFRDVIAPVRARLSSAVANLYRRAAREVLELVRPRRLPFGSHSATPADRDYLISLLETGYEDALASSRATVAEELRNLVNRAAAAAAAAPLVGDEALGDIHRTAEDAIHLLEAQVFSRARAYVRGYLRGGYVDAFFRQEIANLELSEDSVYHALYRDSPNLDAEIAPPLAAASRHALETLCIRLLHWAGIADTITFDLEVGVARVLRKMSERQGQWTGCNDGA